MAKSDPFSVVWVLLSLCREAAAVHSTKPLKSSLVSGTWWFSSGVFGSWRGWFSSRSRVSRYLVLVAEVWCPSCCPSEVWCPSCCPLEIAVAVWFLITKLAVEFLSFVHIFPILGLRLATLANSISSVAIIALQVLNKKLSSIRSFALN